MTSLPDDLDRFLERVLLPDGWRVLHEPSVTSTNDLAREAARRGWPARSVFVADYQTAGRGRQGRSWTAPARDGPPVQRAPPPARRRAVRPAPARRRIRLRGDRATGRPRAG